jgi:hypothetical protein
MRPLGEDLGIEFGKDLLAHCTGDLLLFWRPPSPAAESRELLLLKALDDVGLGGPAEAFAKYPPLGTLLDRHGLGTVHLLVGTQQGQTTLRALW